MTVVHNANTSGGLNQISVCCDGVFLSSHTRGGATVIAASGEIDAANLHHLTEYTQRHLAARAPLVIDLAELNFLGAQGILALFEIDARCRDAGAKWALVPSHPVRRLLRICDKDERLPAVVSVDEALERFSRRSRTHQLLELVTKTG